MKQMQVNEFVKVMYHEGGRFDIQSRFVESYNDSLDNPFDSYLTVFDVVDDDLDSMIDYLNRWN